MVEPVSVLQCIGEVMRGVVVMLTVTVAIILCYHFWRFWPRKEDDDA